MKISIIIPIYNMECYLGECLDSVLTQNFKDYEIICINDGSTDRTAEILKCYAESDSRIQVIHKANSGQADARNTGLSIAKGDYICFLDSDDLLASGALNRMYVTAVKNQIEVLSFEMSSLIFENKRMHEKYKKIYAVERHEYLGVMTGKQLFVEMMDNQEYDNSIGLIFINRDWLVLLGIRFYSGIFYEDSLFVLQCFLKCKRICHVRQKNYIYRIREQSTMRAVPKYNNMRSWLVILKEIQNLLFQEKDEEVKQRLIDYTEAVVRNAKCMQINMPQSEREKYSNFCPDERFFSACLDIGTEYFVPNERLYLKGFSVFIEEQSKVVLYGAGEKGCKMYRYLQHESLEHCVDCFAVTDYEEDGREVLGVPVCSIPHLINKRKEILILVTADRKHRKQMLPLLKYLGFEKVEVMNDLLEQYIDHRLEL